MTDAQSTSLPERPLFLVVLATGPAIWMAHFLVTYLIVSIWCSPRYAGEQTSSLTMVNVLIGIITVAALLGIGIVARSGFKRHHHGTETAPHDSDTPEDRHRFLGFATLLLAGLSAVATVFVAISAFYFSTCR
jgi:heme A synthase